ncbi:MAG: HNH endonuclease [Proteobacteria bacterium]|nr:HNH endonuclease [Pseudomonadota bacterium]MBU1648251.1 HNH endonuclease [Pseudomonadota bacterium]MBU1986145.1 HNH endonuclease [Pseudomonadota bacterium]
MAGAWRELTKLATRSPGWKKVREGRIKIDGKRCRACTKKFNLQVHHIQPFHLQPELELDLDNTLTLCGRCHLLIGHLDCWQSANQNVLVDVTTISLRIKERK